MLRAKPMTQQQKITLWWASGSPYARKVQMVLEEKGLQYDSKLIQISRGDNKTPEFLARNPRGKIPVLQDDDIILYESDAIVFYLEENYPENPVFPTNKKAKALALTRYFEVNNYVSPAFLPLFQFVMNRRRVEDHLIEFNGLVKDYKTELHKFEDYLQCKAYLADEFSAADICLFVILDMMARGGWKIADSKEFPNLSAFYTRVQKRPSAIASYPPHWKESPAPSQPFINL